jgi:membrane-associated phospholipid phosphatase
MKEIGVREWTSRTVDSTWTTPTAQFDGQLAILPVATNGALRVWQSLKRQLAETWEACGAYEWLALGYLGGSSALILIFAQNLAHPLRLLGAQGLAAAIVLTLCRVQARSAARAETHGVSFASRWWHFWRHWYPHLFFLFCFEELAYLMTLVTPHWQDAKLIAFDYWLTGVHPSVWLEQFATTGRNEFMQAVYLSYFTYLLILGAILYARREWKAYWSIMAYSMAGYMIGYFIAMLFPVESPWFSLAGWWKAPLAGGSVTATINFIEHFGRVRGAAFPSQHVAGAVAALWGAWKFRRWLFWTMLPVFLCMCVSTVWGRYHYVGDVLAGMTTGTLGFLIGKWIMERRRAVATAPELENA